MTDPNQIKPDLPIAQRRHHIIESISQAAKRANRHAADVTLIAVSKMQPDDRISSMLDTGQIVFGENRVQEAQARWSERFADSRNKIELRLIGPLQSNKAEEAAALFDVIETVDREKLLKALVKARNKGVVLPRLYVQVNTGEEAQKAGIAPAKLGAFLKIMRDIYELEVEGLMCIPPINETSSPHFWFLKNLAVESDLSKLSMGMSGDFETAIELGATSVRVGSALFGDRSKP